MASIEGRVVPADICSEILSWLPAKEALKGRTICRAFEASSRDSTFFCWQSRRAADISGLFLRNHYYNVFEMVLIDECSDIPPESLQFLNDGNKRIMGSRSGIVFIDTVAGELRSSAAELYLYNPVHRSLQKIPRSGDKSVLTVRAVGVSILFTSEDMQQYEVVCMSPTSEWTSNMNCWLYSTKDGTWKLIGRGGIMNVGPRNIKFHSPVVTALNGRVIYLASDCGVYQKQDPYIVAVDVDSEESKIMPLPGKILATARTGKLDEIAIASGRERGALNLVHFNSKSKEFTTWEVKDPGRSWVWEQRAQMSMADMGLRPRPVRVLSFVNGGVLVFTMEEEIYIHNLEDEGHQVKVIKGRHGCCSYVCAYSNTFWMCGESSDNIYEGDTNLLNRWT